MTMMIALFFSLCITRSCVMGFVVSPTTATRQTTLFDTPPTRVTKESSLYSSQDESEFDKTCDVLVLGSGPAARAISSLLARKKFNVVLSDANYDREWAPNYGVWRDEWDAVLQKYLEHGIEFEGGNVGDCIDRQWAVTDCFFGGSFNVPMEQRTRLDRPYCRVDKNALSKSLSKGYNVLEANHVSTCIAPNLYKPAGSLVHDEDGTTIQLQPKLGELIRVRTKLVVDCTGHESKLVLKDTKSIPNEEPGFQIAYGAVMEVDYDGVDAETHIGPYFREAMTLFDYRTDHLDEESQLSKATLAPTFMYAMPLQDNQIFFEETSLVARPAVSFQECKDRCFQRLEHLGIKVKTVSEEEFCYIPMGGPLPVKNQRIVGLGGASAMVHPSTGYHICRALMGATDMAQAIAENLESGNNLEKTAANAYHSLWSPSNIRQRNFAVFGGEFLMKQNVVGLRGFFDGFFRLDLEKWGGFLAGWPGLPYNENHETWTARMWFGLIFIIKLPFPVALDMFLSIVGYSLTRHSLLQSVTPLFGEPFGYQYEEYTANVGDVAAKNEAMEMIAESTVTELLPVAFENEQQSIEKVPATAVDNTDDALDNEATLGSFQ